MNKQTGQVVVLVLLIVCLTAGLWAFMRWSNHQALHSLNQNIARLDSVLVDKDESLDRLQQEKQNLIDELASSKSLLAAETARFTAQEQSLQDELSQIKSLLSAESARFLEEEAAIKNELATLQSLFEAQSRTLDELNQSIEVKQSTIMDLESAVTEQSSSVDSLEQEKQTLLADIANMTEELTSGQAAVAALAAERDSIAAQVQTLEGELAELDQYSQQLNQQYQRVQNELASEVERSENYSQQIESLEEQYANEQAALAMLEKEINQYRSDNQSLQAKNSTLIDNNQQLDVERRQLIQQYENGISVIRLPNRILFPTGSAELSPQGREALAFVASTLKSFPEHLISVEGHTDHRPIGNALFNRFPSNWELSSARAASAIRVLVEEDIPPRQFQVVGFADTRPLVDKTKTEQISLNRRIEILLFPPIERKLKELKPTANN